MIQVGRGTAAFSLFSDPYKCSGSCWATGGIYLAQSRAKQRAKSEIWAMLDDGSRTLLLAQADRQPSLCLLVQVEWCWWGWSASSACWLGVCAVQCVCASWLAHLIAGNLSDKSLVKHHAYSLISRLPDKPCWLIAAPAPPQKLGLFKETLLFLLKLLRTEVKPPQPGTQGSMCIICIYCCCTVCSLAAHLCGELQAFPTAVMISRLVCCRGSGPAAYGWTALQSVRDVRGPLLMTGTWFERLQGNKEGL